MDFELILVNVDLFREMGIDPSVTDDWDWDTFLKSQRNSPVLSLTARSPGPALPRG